MVFVKQRQLKILTSTFNDRSNFFQFPSLKHHAFWMKLIFKKYFVIKCSEQFSRRKKWQRTVEHRKKIPIVVDAPPWDPRSPSDLHTSEAKCTLLMAHIVQQVPNWAVQHSTKTYRSTEMAKASSHVHCWTRLNYATDKFVPCVHLFFSVCKNEMCRFVWKLCYRGNPESTSM